MTGKIKRLMADKGFGFVRGDDGVERFFHRSGFKGDFNSLYEGQSVEFEEQPSEKGPRATDVRVTSR